MPLGNNISGAKSIDDEALKKLQHYKKHNNAQVNSEPSQRAASEAPAVAVAAAIWTAEQQAQLEKALKTYPPSWSGEGDRWENIAEMVPTKSKKECKQRVKVQISRLFNV